MYIGLIYMWYLPEISFGMERDISNPNDIFEYIKETRILFIHSFVHKYMYIWIYFIKKFNFSFRISKWIQMRRTCLFHQILGLALFNYLSRYSTFLCNKFLDDFLSPKIDEHFVGFCCVFGKLDHLACDIIRGSR